MVVILSRVKVFQYCTNPTHVGSVNKLSLSTLAFLEPKIEHLLTRNKIISHLINMSEIYTAL